MSSVDDNLQDITPDDLMLTPAFSLPQTLNEAPEVVEPEGPDEISKFDQRHRDAFLGLMYIGHLTDEVNHFGHSFKLVTPGTDVRLESGVLHKKFLNTLSGEVAWATITVAMFLQEVDGTPLPQPIGPKDTGLLDRYNWVVKNLYSPVIQKLFESCLILDSKVTLALTELERLGES